MTRHAMSFGFGLLALISLDAVAVPAASTTAPPETVAPSEATAVGNATTIPLAPSASTALTAAPATATQPATAPTAATQVSAAPATSTQVAASAPATPAPTASTAVRAAAAPQPPPPNVIPTQIPPATLCSSAHASLPVRGTNMENVEHIFGTPLEKHEAVGKPPITRWDYADYAVYFEYNLVLHTVMKSAPFGDAQTPTC